MGSSGSKPNVAESSSPAGGGGPNKSRSKSSRTRVHFQSSCLGSHDIENDHDEQISNDQAREVGGDSPCANPIKSDSEHVIPERYRKVKVEHSGEMASISANAELDEWGQSNLSDNVSRGGSTSSQGFSSRSLNLSGRFFSRFSFFRGNVSLRLNRAASLGSSRPYPGSSTSFTIPSDEEELHLGRGSGNGLVNRNGTRLGCDLLPACLINRSPGPHYEESNSGNRCVNPSTSDFSGSIQDDQILSNQDNSRDIDSGVDFGVSLHSPRNRSESEGTEIRFPERRTSGAREPVERNVRFSRALSVGRLRDRVLRRSSFPDLRFCPLQQEGEVRDVIQGVVPGARASEENAFTLSTSSNNMSSSVSSGQVYEVEGSRGRESRYRDLLEHGSNFIERRRRIRSQVRALQRLGSRFENLSGHERSCILSGQHRTGQCTCRLNNRDVNSNDDTNARASISRIVMLAEALFEVLDEIHQQSVVLSSRPSISSLGSVPAPIEVVDSLPLKLYNKSQKHLNEEAVQCYICLVEYEEGDSVRRLPCRHEFHRTCVDKWLKEIHRICPLCRGDICRPDSVTTEG